MKLMLIGVFMILFFISGLCQSPMEIIKEQKAKAQRERREYNEGLVDTSHRYFYKTYEDYISGKPVEGIKYTGKREILMGTESVLVMENDDFTYRKIKDLKYWGFIDEFGQLGRIYKNHSYYTLDTGKICLYIKAIDAEMKTDKNGNISINWLSDNPAGFKDYLSVGLNGDIFDFNEKKFKELTSSSPELFDQYKTDPYDTTVKDKRTQKTFKNRKFVRLYNGN